MSLSEWVVQAQAVSRPRKEKYLAQQWVCACAKSEAAYHLWRVSGRYGRQERRALKQLTAHLGLPWGSQTALERISAHISKAAEKRCASQPSLYVECEEVLSPPLIEELSRQALAALKEALHSPSDLNGRAAAGGGRVPQAPYRAPYRSPEL